ncbi:hypothetical protein [Nocardia terpenica]|uniref:Uncharacterized protein n=1 Tax=Nocardia terpenica TaxID=455432 RepID=A0A164HAE9_9NOCA|nr:hypothetical protein [Nocardia terpenica]KZM68340.1 hypothetical protein AWN90_10660 [Nocardia terpenica]NQE88747.1 hypothetical protein [Nocardia terpenica]
MSSPKTFLSEVYRPELTYLRRRFGVSAAIVDTGGGCLGIRVAAGHAPGSEQPVEVLVTTVDAGLAVDRGEIVHWYACVYDTTSGGTALADGHDPDSGPVAVTTALANLHDAIPASENICPCLLVGGLDLPQRE